MIRVFTVDFVLKYSSRAMGARDFEAKTGTAFRSLWQNGVVERWVGSCQGDLLDHAIVLNAQHPQATTLWRRRRRRDADTGTSWYRNPYGTLTRSPASAQQVNDENHQPHDQE
jgi:hypothetical protein